MKIKICGVLFFISVLVCGGGIDSGSMTQFAIGTILAFVFGGVVAYESNKEEFKHCSDNTHSYPSFLR